MQGLHQINRSLLLLFLFFLLCFISAKTRINYSDNQRCENEFGIFFFLGLYFI